jgi:hypothetical protein
MLIKLYKPLLWERRIEMKLYERKYVFIWGLGEAAARQLYEYGMQGWEFVAVVGSWHYFKRAKMQEKYV